MLCRDGVGGWEGPAVPGEGVGMLSPGQSGLRGAGRRLLGAGVVSGWWGVWWWAFTSEILSLTWGRPGHKHWGVPVPCPLGVDARGRVWEALLAPQ